MTDSKLKDGKMKNESLIPEGPGVRLKQARERAGLTVTGIADVLFLSETAINGIEADDYSQFAGVMFAKGYIRNYAREVGLNGDDLIRSFDKLGLVDDNMAVADSYQSETLNRNENYMRWGALGVASVILLIVFIGWSIKHRPGQVTDKSLPTTLTEHAVSQASPVPVIQAVAPDIQSALNVESDGSALQNLQLQADKIASAEE